MPAISELHELRGSEDWILARLPDEFHTSLTPDLIRAIAEAATPRAWATHPVGIPPVPPAAVRPLLPRPGGRAGATVAPSGAPRKWKRTAS